MLRFGGHGVFLPEILNGNAPFWHAYQSCYERKMNGNAPFSDAFRAISADCQTS